MNQRSRPQPGTAPAAKVNGRARGIALALAAIGLLSYTACTADKKDVKGPETGWMPETKKDIALDPAMKQTPKMVDGVFAAEDQLATVYFELNKSKLSESAMETAKTNAEWLKSQPPYLIRLVGFADQRGSMKKNERLAEKRAIALKDAYASFGIDPARISVVTRGAEDVTCSPVTEDCLAKSRRTETLLEEKNLVSR